MSSAQAKEFVRDRSLIVNPRNDHYGLFVDDNLVSVTGVATQRKGTKLQANYTPPQYRNKGYFSALLAALLEQLPYPIFADCLKDSKGIYERHGFTIYKVKDFKRFTIYYCKKEFK